MIVSGESANGYPGETEIARIGLGPFQELWKKVIQDQCQIHDMAKYDNRSGLLVLVIAMHCQMSPQVIMCTIQPR